MNALSSLLVRCAGWGDQRSQRIFIHMAHHRTNPNANPNCRKLRSVD